MNCDGVCREAADFARSAYHVFSFNDFVDPLLFSHVQGIQSTLIVVCITLNIMEL